jgi:hypothetical protein
VDAKVRDALQKLLHRPDQRIAGTVGDVASKRMPAEDAADAERELVSLDAREQKLLRIATKGLASEDGVTSNSRHVLLPPARRETRPRCEAACASSRLRGRGSAVHGCTSCCAGRAGT